MEISTTIAVLVFILLIAYAFWIAHQKKIEAEKWVKEKHDAKVKQLEGDFIQAVIAYEKARTENKRSIFHFFYWSHRHTYKITNYSMDLTFLGWLNSEFISTDHLSGEPKIEKWLEFQAKLIDRLPYERYLKRDILIAKKLCKTENEFFEKYEDMVMHFQDDFEYDSLEIIDLMHFEDRKMDRTDEEIDAEREVREKLGLTDG
tara:strand:+ start:945 stop:1553 length:609 start_codon:yes stop_codon:yes gene_type:complete